MAAKASLQLTVLLLLLHGATSDSVGNASHGGGTPSTFRVTLVTNVKSIETFTPMSVLPNTASATHLSDHYTFLPTIASDTNYAVKSDMLPTMITSSLEGSLQLMTTLPSWSLTIVSPSMTSLPSPTQLTPAFTPLPTQLTPSPTNMLPSSNVALTLVSSSAMSSPSVMMVSSPVVLSPSVMVASSPVVLSPSVMVVSSSVMSSPSAMVVSSSVMSSPSVMVVSSVMSSPSVMVVPSSSNALPTETLSIVFTETLSTVFTNSIAPYTTTVANTSLSTNTPEGKSEAEEDRKLLLYIGPPAALLVLICIFIGTVLCIRRYRRMRKWRLQLMPLHNLDNADSDEEELLNDDQAPTFQVSDETRQPILTFDD